MKELPKYKPENEQIILTNPHNGRKTITELWNDDKIGTFTVRAGANSDFSYTGLLLHVTNMEEMKTAIVAYHEEGKLFR